ncbi:hypothetical protein PYW08_004161 [Mythimna loreyi]|uniref:Uncharacterized protein n=1 Tax=Mythimna loreyi TaxID=667449 RepID=A0ACC2QVP9_9NEOP|nr:hypothetical protein PYW08_004161 [Mythimna loreyi]
MVKYKESESDSDGSGHATEPRFRVRVCMQRFYGDGDMRARAYVCVAPRRRVSWLQRRLRRLFALPPVRLLSRGHLLPPQEPLALLQPDDPVEVVPADAEPDDTADVPHFVNSIQEAQVTTAEELKLSPSPVSPDDLAESKRQAISMLEQYCGESVTHCAMDAPRVRRKRVRRRRRVPVAGVADSVSDAEERPALGRPGVFRESAAAAMVLRDELQPRAPRVVRPLADPTTATSPHMPPDEIVAS